METNGDQKKGASPERITIPSNSASQLVLNRRRTMFFEPNQDKDPIWVTEHSPLNLWSNKLEKDMHI